MDAGQSGDRVASGRNVGRRRIRRLQVERAVRLPAVVMAHVDAKDVLQVAAAGDA